MNSPDRTAAPSAEHHASTSGVSAGSPLILGIMGWGGGWGVEALTEHAWAEAVDRARTALHASLEAGITTIDAADIYAHGRSEETLGRLLAEDPTLRERIQLQSKAGILVGGSPLYSTDEGTIPESTRYDSGPAQLRRAVTGSLERLQTDQLDTLIIHRPDPLTRPDDTVEAYLELHRDGAVRSLGLSNMSSAWVRRFDDVLRSATDGAQQIQCVQVELGLHHRHLVESVVLANHPEAATHAVLGEAAGLMELCLERGITLQAWGSMGQGRYSRAPEVATDQDRWAAQVVAQIAEENACAPEAVVLGWLLRLPWQIRPVVGTTDRHRIHAAAEAEHAAESMSAQQWYRLWTAARGAGLP